MNNILTLQLAYSQLQLTFGAISFMVRIIFYQVGERTFSEKDFYQTLSKNLPPWTVLYFPPNSIHQKGEPLTYPVVFEKGEMLLFKKSKH
ncbi:MAG: hypothetical protein AB2992_05440 [Candidatus Symbiodolus clandestinus]